jgi:hypothetical protein
MLLNHIIILYQQVISLLLAWHVICFNKNKKLIEENIRLVKISNDLANTTNKTKQHKTYSKKNRVIYPFFIIGCFCLVLGLSLLIFPVNIHAVTVTLAWDNSSGATGYKIYSGTTSNSYSWVTDVGNVTSYTTADLANGYTYYFAATAYDASRVESGYSTEVSFNNSTRDTGGSNPATTQTSYTISATVGCKCNFRVKQDLHDYTK